MNAGCPAFCRKTGVTPVLKTKTDEGVSTFAYTHPDISECRVRRNCGGKAKYPAFCRRWALSAGGEKLNVISQNSFGFECNKDPSNIVLLGAFMV
jgi:hypothetical protein